MRISDWSSDVCSSDLWLRRACPEASGAAGRLLPRLSVTRTGLADSNLVILLSSTVAPRSQASCWVDVRTIWSVPVMSRPFSVAAAMLVRILPLGVAVLDWKLGRAHV